MPGSLKKLQCKKQMKIANYMYNVKFPLIFIIRSFNRKYFLSSYIYKAIKTRDDKSSTLKIIDVMFEM